MKNSILIVASLATAISISATPAFAQRGRAGATQGTSATGAGHSEASSHSGSGNANATNGRIKTPDQLLTQNTKLSDNLAKLLPAGTTPQQACQNFKNLGQCVAAIHVAQNRGIDFNSLACDMTLKPVAPATTCPAGTGTGSKGMSLGKSIQTLDPNADAKGESKRATIQAKADLKESNS
jgi:hypothetical protein